MNVEEVDVRRVGSEAAPTLAALEAASLDGPWTADALRRLLDDGFTHAFVAYLRDQAVGSAVVRVVAGEGELLRMAVRPRWRRHGIGRRILRSIASAVGDACAEGIHLEVRESNVAARALYTGAGFRECGRRRDYYTAPREDAILMRWRPPAAEQPQG